MKSLMLLTRVLLEELGSMLGTCTARDWETVTRRVEEEGISFLTITLPGFGADFQTALDTGLFAPELASGFRRTRNSRLPAFLRGFVGQVFDEETGSLLEVPNPDAIRAVRQFTLFHSKIQIPCSDARTRKAIDEYYECEKEVRQANTQLTELDYRRFRRMVHLLFGSVLDRCEAAIRDLYNSNGSGIKPKHGPGATADRKVGNEKWLQTEWTERLERIMPAGEMLIPNWRHFDLLGDIDFLEPGAERPVRVITVPKTLKTPRIIAIEPTAMQYSQQALSAMLIDEIGVNPVSPMIGFDDQIPNQEMAEMGSLTGSLATLDLSSASDRVSNQLVLELFRDWPRFSEAVQASRSLRADVPGYGVIPLAKFASMGSALTFPVEAMVFLTLTMMGVADALSVPASRLNDGFIRRMIGSVRVYGDDIICPTDSVPAVIDRLETYGFKVGQHKSFWTGLFRESCGKEYYAGHDVSVVKCRHMLPSSLQNVDEVISTVSLRNQLYAGGLWATARHLDRLLESIFRGHYPTVEPTSPVLGRHSFLGYQAEREHPTLHSPLVKGYVVKDIIPRNSLDGVPALLKWLLKRGDEPYADDHLERSGRPQSVYIKLRWQSPF